ncbi:TIGR02301 family protein [Aquamicrobium zhengzhouense]|nr:TIGR02301 family protein [Aquamicrobium zhengzhouense]
MIRRLLLILPAALALTLAPPLRAADSPIENQLLRISEILGALHYLRNLCGEESTEWRDRMNSLLEAENPDESRRVKFVASFNSGYRSFEETYATCTSSAVEAINRYTRDGEALARDTATRFGN